MSKENLIKKLKELDVVEYGYVNLKHSGDSQVYFNIKKAYGFPSILSIMADHMLRNTDKRTTCLVASGYGGIPLATIMSCYYDLKLTIVRDTTKDHGKPDILLGHIPNNNDKITIIDDVLTTGKSIETIIEAIKPTHAEILGCNVVIKRGEANLPIPINYLFTVEDFL